MSAAREFSLGAVLSVTTDRLVARGHMDDLYSILNFMTGDNLYTHALPRASEECRPALLAQHPQLAEVEVPDWDFDDRDEAQRAVFEWLDRQERRYGETLLVEPLGADEHTRIDPISELRMMRPDVPIVAVVPDEDAS